MNQTKALLLRQARAYPEMEPQDLFKFLYQAVFGCEHMVISREKALERIREEAKTLQKRNDPIEPLSEAYSRVPLSYLNAGLDAETLGKLFYLSAAEGPKGTAEKLEEALNTAKELVREGVFSFGLAEFEIALTEWKDRGCPALHHSPAFRTVYAPAYRVIDNRFIPLLPLLAAIDRGLKKGPLKLAIEGGSAAGKTTLAALLEQLYGCALFHMDDFFLRPEQRTPARLAEPGGNADRERFAEEVLLPLGKDQPVIYRPFDCSVGALSAPVTVAQKQLTVVEGAYSMHPELADHYDLSVFLEISPELQKERIEKRNSPFMARRFFNEWIPMERLYFEKLQIKERCSIVLQIH